MVKINTTTWVTPTSYGLVFTHITPSHQLRRVFLDKEATESLLKDESNNTISQISEKGIDVNGIQYHKESLSKEKNQCDMLVQKNKWFLFSLYPLQYSVQTVNFCNARCDFCYANAPNIIDKKTMNLETIFQLKDYAAIHGVKFGVSGGEPLLHPSLFDILSYRKEEVFDTLITNLTAPFDTKLLIKSDVDLIQVSIHGHQAYHNNLLKIPHAYDHVFTNMKTLFPTCNLATNTVITPENIDSIPLLLDDLAKLQERCQKQLTYVRFVPVVPSGTGKDIYELHESFLADVTYLLKKIETNYKDLTFEIPFFHANPYEYFFKDNHWVCPAGSTVAVIRIDGYIIPCNQYLDTAITSKYTIFDNNIHDLWLVDSLLSKMRKGITTSNTINCKECRYLFMEQNQGNEGS